MSLLTTETTSDTLFIAITCAINAQAALYLLHPPAL